MLGSEGWGSEIRNKIKIKYVCWKKKFEEYALWTMWELIATHGMNTACSIWNQLTPTGTFG
jgi:hypothetical protein